MFDDGRIEEDPARPSGMRSPLEGLTISGLASILATSREVLDIDGEHTVVLAPLPSDSADSPAVRLFAERATSIDSKFVLNDESSR